MVGSTSTNPRSVSRDARLRRADVLGDRAAPDRHEHLVDLDLLRALGRLERHDDPGRRCAPACPTRASPCTVRPRRVSERASTFATSRSGPSGRIGFGSASSSVVLTPRSVKTDANSAPITPPPITATRSGSFSASLLVLWSEVMTLTPSTSMPGIARGADPAQMITARPGQGLRAAVLAVTATAPSAVSRPQPITTLTLRRLSRPDSPLCRLPTMPALRLFAAGQSGSGAPPPGSFTPCSAAWFDGPEHLGGVQQRLGRDAAAVQAGAAHLVRLDQGDRQPGGGGVERRRVTAGAAAQDDDVVVGHLRLHPHARATFRSVSAISAGCGMIASSSGGLVASACSSPRSATIGWSRCQKASSWIVAAISAP